MISKYTAKGRLTMTFEDAVVWMTPTLLIDARNATSSIETLSHLRSFVDIVSKRYQWETERYPRAQASDIVRRLMEDIERMARPFRTFREFVAACEKSL